MLRRGREWARQLTGAWSGLALSGLVAQLRGRAAEAQRSVLRELILW
jgi:hypothetical protein